MERGIRHGKTGSNGEIINHGGVSSEYMASWREAISLTLSLFTKTPEACEDSVKGNYERVTEMAAGFRA